jgi:hypothetical protein
MTAAVGAWILAWGDTIAKALEEDCQWGTTTMRPRPARGRASLPVVPVCTCRSAGSDG